MPEERPIRLILADRESRALYAWPLDQPIYARLAAAAYWEGYVAGELPGDASFTATPAPLTAVDSPCVTGIHIQVVAEGGASWDDVFSLEVLAPLARRLAAEMVHRGLLDPGQPYTYRLQALGQVQSCSPRPQTLTLPAPVVREFPSQAPVNGHIPVVFSDSALGQVLEHSRSSQDEVVGGLLGNLCVSPLPEKRPFLSVEAQILAAGAAGSSHAVKLAAPTWLQLRRSARSAGIALLGWWHSHPFPSADPSTTANHGHGNLFFSEADHVLHELLFPLPWQLGLVCDPVLADTPSPFAILAWKRAQLSRLPLPSEVVLQ